VWGMPGAACLRSTVDEICRCPSLAHGASLLGAGTSPATEHDTFSKKSAMPFMTFGRRDHGGQALPRVSRPRTDPGGGAVTLHDPSCRGGNKGIRCHAECKLIEAITTRRHRSTRLSPFERGRTPPSPSCRTSRSRTLREAGARTSLPLFRMRASGARPWRRARKA